MLRDRKLKSKEESKWVKQNGKTTKHQESSIVVSIGTDGKIHHIVVFLNYISWGQETVFSTILSIGFPVHADFM